MLSMAQPSKLTRMTVQCKGSFTQPRIAEDAVQFNGLCFLSFSGVSIPVQGFTVRVDPSQGLMKVFEEVSQSKFLLEVNPSSNSLILTVDGSSFPDGGCLDLSCTDC